MPSPFRRDCNGGCSGSRMLGICTRARASSCSTVDRMGTILSRTHSQTFTLTCKHDHSPRHQTRRPSFTQDMLGALVQLSVVGGGPNCRPWSILRWFPKRLGGLDANNDQEQEDTDNDSVLLLRQMVITDLGNNQCKGGLTPSWNTLKIPSCAASRPPQANAPPYGSYQNTGTWPPDRPIAESVVINVFLDK